MEKSVGSDASVEAEKPSVPPFPYNNAAGRAVANAGKPLANVDHEEILARLRQGETPRQLAETIGVSHQAVYEWLLRNHADEWASISASKSLTRLENAEKDIDEADDKVAISKARESHRMGQWTLERVARKLYGETKPDNGSVTINVVLDRSCDGAIIEAKPA